MFNQTHYPFVAIVGQESAKKALLIAVTNPQTGGLLVGGKKGTGKTTLVRSIQNIIENDLVNLPLNTTEDMLFGSIDIEHAIKEGKKRFNEGLLAKANDQIVYIDDVNLLRVELLSAVLESNLKGSNTVERDGISFEHPVHFTVIGTMNPEEGTLPTQVLDRFGMYIETENQTQIDDRIALMKSLLNYEENRAHFVDLHKESLTKLKGQVLQAQKLLPEVILTDAMLTLAAQMCAQAYCAGHRAELYLIEVARTIAALDQRTYLLPKDMEEAALYVLPHRMRKPPEETMPEPDNQDDSSDEPEEEQTPPESQEEDPPSSEDEAESQEENGSDASEPQMNQDDKDEQNSDENQNDDKNSSSDAPSNEDVFDIDKSFNLPKISIDLGLNKKVRQGSGKRSLTRTSLKQGRYVRSSISRGKVTDLAFDATIRAAAPFQKIRTKNCCAINIKQEDLRVKVREKRIGNTFLFIVDASGSMGAAQRMRAVKGAIFHMLQEAYQKRDRVGMIAFRKEHAEVLLPITRSVNLAQKSLKTMPTGGKTPLSDGLRMGLTVLSQMNKKELEQDPIVVLVTDGRANTSIEEGDPVELALQYAQKLGYQNFASVVIDTETDFIKLGIAKKVAVKMGASYYKLDQLSKEKILHIVGHMDGSASL